MWEIGRQERRGFTIPGTPYVIIELKKYGVTKLDDKKILDLGCGSGGELRKFVRYGARPENCSGIDLLPERIENAKRISPNIDFRCGDASRPPFEDGSFNIVLQFTVFTPGEDAIF